MKKALIIFLILTAFGCNNKNENIDTLFISKRYLSSERYLSIPKVLAPIEIFANKKGNIFITEHQEDKFAAFIDNNGVLFRFCPIGRGPGENIPPSFFSRSKREESVGFYSPRSQKYHEYKLAPKDSVKTKLIKEINGFSNASKLLCINDSVFFAIAASINSLNRYELYDKNGDFINSNIEYPENGSQKIPDELKPIAYQSNISYNSKHNIIISACLYVEHIELLSIKSGEIERKFVLHTSDGTFDNTSSSNFNSIKPDKNNVMSYLCLDAGEDYFYVLYSGRNTKKYSRQEAFLGNTILKFDYTGKPIEKLILDNDILSFSVSKGNLYAIGLNSNEPVILKYKL